MNLHKLLDTPKSSLVFFNFLIIFTTILLKYGIIIKIIVIAGNHVWSARYSEQSLLCAQYERN